jgi:hypothetical protein
MLTVEPTGAALVGSRVMAIGLHNIDRHLTRSDSPSMFGIKQIPSLFRTAVISEAGMRLTTRSISDQFPIRRRPETFAAPGQCSCGLASTGDPAVYNEEAFRYLLDIERNRFEASSQPFVLILVELMRRLGHPDRMPAATASQIFGSLTRTLRDTDVVGWYRDQRIIGAVLTHLGDMALPDSTPQMSARVTKAFGNDLPGDTANRLKVRLYRPRARMTR